MCTTFVPQVYYVLYHRCTTGENMGKQHVNARFEVSTIEAVDSWAKSHGTTRSAALEALVLTGLNMPDAPPGPPSDARETAQEAAQEEERTEAHNDDSRAVIAVLRRSNEDLRAEVSRLWAQMAEKDQQIRTAQNLADHAQQLHAAEVTRALPAEAGKHVSWWERLTGRGRGE